MKEKANLSFVFFRLIYSLLPMVIQWTEEHSSQRSQVLPPNLSKNMDGCSTKALDLKAKMKGFSQEYAKTCQVSSHNYQVTALKTVTKLMDKHEI